MQRSGYKRINQFGTKIQSEAANPLTYCINDTISRGFLHGGNAMIYGQNSSQCQSFLSEYCAQGWDEACEFASRNTRIYMPNDLPNANIGGRPYNLKGLSAGEILVRNTAATKYLVSMGNCVPKLEAFDPSNASSPMIQTWKSYTGVNDCIPLYAVNPDTIDDDVVMDKVLTKPTIALDILLNIYNNHKRADMLDALDGTKIGAFFKGNPSLFE